MRFNMLPYQRLFDWGSGCGHMTTWFAKYFGVLPFGLDILEGSVSWANAFSAGRHCHYDGNQNLDWIPNQFFDFVVSCGALIHATDQCSKAKELLRKVKVGGKAWFGCMPYREKEPKEDAKESEEEES